MNSLQFTVVAFVLVIARVTAFFSTFPLFRSGMLPNVIKVSLAVALSAMWFSSFAIDGSAPLPSSLPSDPLAVSLGVLREAIIGALLGYLLGLLFLPAELAGSYLGQELGFNMAGMADPTTDTRSNVFGDLLNAFAMFVFFAVDAHQLAIGAIYASFQRLPLAASLPQMPIGTIADALGQAHVWGLELAAPLASALFLVTIITAMMMKVSPQLNLFSIGIPVRLTIGLLAAIAFLPAMVRVMQRIFAEQFHLLRDLGL